MKDEIGEWLLESDPSIRWQVMRDIHHVEEPEYARERKKLVEKGWCARLLEQQAQSGLWNKSLYSGKWVSTTYTLQLLKVLGLPQFNQQALAGCNQLLNQGLFSNQEIRFSRNKAIQDLGVTGLVLSICCYFGQHHQSIHGIAKYLVDQQCSGGNWLPNDSEGSIEYSFETTLIVLEGLLQYRERYPDAGDWLASAEWKGQEFLLEHNLYLKGEEPIKKEWTSFSFPSYWFYDVLTALEYFRLYRKNFDRRIQPAIDLVKRKRNKEGVWMLGRKHVGKTYFEMERSGSSSRWNTLRALRVMNWWK